MTQARPRKLIETVIPLPEINDASAYDKMPGIGPHPKGIHHWWARLPLPCARAILFASVVDDPADVEGFESLPAPSNPPIRPSQESTCPWFPPTGYLRRRERRSGWSPWSIRTEPGNTGYEWKYHRIRSPSEAARNRVGAPTSFDCFRQFPEEPDKVVIHLGRMQERLFHEKQVEIAEGRLEDLESGLTETVSHEEVMRMLREG